VSMDTIAILLSLFIDIYFMSGIFLYILASRAYSYRGIRLKKYAIVGYVTVIVFQGAVTFWLVYYGSSATPEMPVPVSGMVASSLLIGGFYPLTQIYQHDADRKDGVQTISRLLGYKGTFVLTAIIYSIAMMVLAYHFFSQSESIKFCVLTICMSPILVYFFRWAHQVWKDKNAANFSNTMRMNLLASVFTNLSFIILLIWQLFE
jgi:1,4-dihydroxy-2-naphthoate polyprenyltransferase